MKKVSKILSLLAVSTMIISVLSISASAQKNSGLDILPITDKDYWEVEVAQNSYKPIGSEGAWIKTTVDNKGALTMQRTADAKVAWPRVRTLREESLPTYSLKDNPYFYYDFEATGANWMIQLNYGSSGGITVKLAQAICKQSGTASLASMDNDGLPGKYKGKINLNQVIKDAGIKVLTDKKDFSPSIDIYIVDSGTSGVLKFNSLSIGNDDQNSPAGPKLDSKLKGGDSAPSAAAATTTAAKSSTATTASAVSTTKAAVTSDNSTTASTTDKSVNGPTSSSHTGMYIIIGVVAAVVIAGCVVTFIVLKKKKTGKTSESK